ncbi:hypothetical protein mru_1336 [Methanobrevibacter ruminantium M1]|uniref:Uncharacterized protein n=1 Tax=Methanobrevibacter ruminantium (strain ATCC 35063 / DSM 1093 / JCM 13430 / OCM 146 / M1) TaxID=634498 RepID=D3E3S5_METRM|nr:hypothetical protein [Methanobrevibacter ruminantium]ADC47186.1 hypothetical protein mru_1336 [Methanobrevibacter ruminantium M1]
MNSEFIILFSHILPLILGFFSILLMINGIMDKQKVITAFGIILFLAAAFSPFVVLPILGV